MNAKRTLLFILTTLPISFISNANISRSEEDLVKNGTAEAQYELGKKYEKGENIQKNLKRAFELYELAAKNSFIKAQLRLCITNQLGKEYIPKNYIKAAAWCTLAAEQGNADGQYLLANLYEQGKGVSQDYSKAFELYKKAAEQGHESAKLNLARFYAEGKGHAKNLYKAIEIYKEVSLNGSGEAQYLLGGLYFNEMEGKEAVKWLTKAADKNNKEAYYLIAIIYDFGKELTKDVQEDDLEAIKWYMKDNDLFSQLAIARIYHRSEVLRDDKKAFQWYEKAANQNISKDTLELYTDSFGDNIKILGRGIDLQNDAISEASYVLGTMYATGQGTLKNNAKAFEYYLKAAQRNSSIAQFTLAEAYLNGYLGVVKSTEKSIIWLKKSASQGYEPAKTLLKKVGVV